LGLAGFPLLEGFPAQDFQMGCTFTQWKRLVVFQRAAERLSEGSSVTTHAPAIRQIVQHAHPIEVRPAHHRHRPNAPQLKQRRVTSLSGPTGTSLSGVYSRISPIHVMEYASSAEVHDVSSETLDFG
jgi:hypothetical protein